jgi:hypothetical protein
MHKSEPEMMEAAKLVRYEWDQFSWAVGLWSDGGSRQRQPGTGHDAEMNGAIELLLLHCRVLRDFFVNIRVKLSKKYQDDILAEDFFDDPHRWTRPPLPLLADPEKRLDKTLAHLTYSRTKYHGPGKGWSIDLIVAEMKLAWSSFLATLPPERRLWF